MIRPIVHDTDFLSRRAAEALPADRSVGQDLLDTLRANQERCVGLAANMIGECLRIIAVNDEGTLRVMYNPEIVRRSRPYETREGCLSLSGERAVTRYACIRLRWQDEQLAWHEQAFLGLTAQIIQHECDHCEGVLV